MTDNNQIKTLLPINMNETLNVQSVSAKSLYDWLTDGGNGQYSRWVKKNILNNQFALEGSDYAVLDTVSTTSRGGKKAVDYALSIDYAKKLAMMSKCQKGEEAREYFLECEKVAKAVAIPQLQPMSQLDLLQVQLNVLKQQQAQIEEHSQQLSEQAEIQQNQEEILSAVTQNQAVQQARLDALDCVNIDGDGRTQLNNLVRKYARDNGIQYNDAWTSFYNHFDNAFKCRIRARARNYARTNDKPKSFNTISYICENDLLGDALRIAYAMFK